MTTDSIIKLVEVLKPPDLFTISYNTVLARCIVSNTHCHVKTTNKMSHLTGQFTHDVTSDNLNCSIVSPSRGGHLIRGVTKMWNRKENGKG